MDITISLIGTSPLLMHNPRMVDPNFDIAREIKSISGKRKKTDEDLAAIERLEWYGGLYVNDGVITQPTSKVRKCLINTAKISRLGKAVERSVAFLDLNVPLVYDGPKEVDEVFEIDKFRSRLSVGIGGKRVMRCRPQFMPWGLSVDVCFIEDAGLNFEDLQRIVTLAGQVEGIGDNRVNGYGRFESKVEVTQ